MSITNYDQLQTAIGTWLNRSNLTGYIPDFITLAASRIYYGSDDPILPSAPVRTWSMQAQESPTVTSGTAPLPARYLSTILLRGNSGTRAWTLDYQTPSIFATNTNRSDSVASFYTILNNQIVLSSSATTDVTHDYYQSFEAMSDDSDTNALLTAAPSLWLYASLIEAAVFEYDDENAKKWHRMYSSVSTGLNRNAKDYGGGSLQVVAR